MWTLFKRECEEIWTYLVIFGVLIAFLIAIVEFTTLDWVVGIILAYIILCLLLLAIASSRMIIDRNHGLSTFFAGHLTTRGQVFAVRIVMGGLYVIVFGTPMIGWFFWKWLQEFNQVQPYTDIDLVQRILQHLPAEPFIQMSVFLLLLFLACYNLGLRMGLAANKTIPVLGSLGLCILLLSFVVLKGFGMEAIILLIILNLSLIYSSWRHYAAAAL